jgi:hypothetical protein
MTCFIFSILMLILDDSFFCTITKAELVLHHVFQFKIVAGFKIQNS